MTKSRNLGVVMDPIQSIHFKKDSSFAMLLEAEVRGYRLHYFEQKDLFVRDGKAFGNAKLLRVFNNAEHWVEFEEHKTIELSDLDVILMRKDPPFDIEYIYTTYILELAESKGVKVINKPQSLRDYNEKFCTSWFPQCCPPTLITRDIALLRRFFQEQKDIVCKPLEGMGGASVFRLQYPDFNTSVVMEVLSKNGCQYMMAQQYISDITQGDKRILMINGEPIPYALARIPAEGELRGNLAAGGKGIAKPLTKRDYWICQQVGPFLREKGLYFVGLDVIGDFLTEINITSPTCIRELEEQCNLAIGVTFFDFIDTILH
jgi:glutathione synthase